MWSSFVFAAIATNILAQRPPNESICNYYAKALNASQKDLLTQLVNTAVIGNYTQQPSHLAVPGILNPKPSSNATYNGTKVNLLPYFSGTLKSTNTGKGHGVSVNFFDGGGADALKQSKPADSQNSRQYTLMSHLYSFFGMLLGCSDAPAYKGDLSMYEVHKYMDLDLFQVQYFIEQVGLAALSFGVTQPDVMSVGQALQGLFGFRCAPKTSVNGYSKPELQSICIASGCPEAKDATCKAYSGPTTSLNIAGTGTAPSNSSLSGTSGAAALNLAMGLIMLSLAAGFAVVMTL